MYDDRFIIICVQYQEGRRVYVLCLTTTRRAWSRTSVEENSRELGSPFACMRLDPLKRKSSRTERASGPRAAPPRSVVRTRDVTDCRRSCRKRPSNSARGVPKDPRRERDDRREAHDAHPGGRRARWRWCSGDPRSARHRVLRRARRDAPARCPRHWCATPPLPLASVSRRMRRKELGRTLERAPIHHDERS